MSDNEDTLVMTDPSILPQWKGRPVPWVTRWTGAITRDRISVGRTTEGECCAFYPDGNEDRDSTGVLWWREGITRTGEPEFAQVSTYRQRASMRRRLCQVCGQKITDRAITWLIDPRQINQLASGETVTTSPPTCASCVPLALELCPAMRQDYRIARVLEYEVFGVSGSVVRLNEEGKIQQVNNALINFRRTDYPFSLEAVVAKQQAVQWTKFKIEGD